SATISTSSCAYSVNNYWAQVCDGYGVCSLIMTAHYPMDEGSGGVLNDLSGNGNQGTIHDNEGDQWVDGKYGKALQFDGVDDYVSVASSDSLDVTDKITMRRLANSFTAISSETFLTSSIWTTTGTAVSFLKSEGITQLFAVMILDFFRRKNSPIKF
ncbi:unnamed protein product, partial [marine sediment metagenome]